MKTSCYAVLAKGDVLLPNQYWKRKSVDQIWDRFFRKQVWYTGEHLISTMEDKVQAVADYGRNHAGSSIAIFAGGISIEEISIREIPAESIPVRFSKPRRLIEKFEADGVTPIPRRRFTLKPEYWVNGASFHSSAPKAD